MRTMAPRSNRGGMDKSAASSIRIPPPARQLVALVDADDPSRRALHLLLQGHGHQVRAYSSSAALRSDPLAIDANWLVLMQADGADEALAALRARNWAGRALLVSAGADGQTDREAPCGSIVMPGPLSSHDLLRLIDGPRA